MPSFSWLFAGGVVPDLFWCDTVRSGCWFGRGSYLRIVCCRFDSVQVNSDHLTCSLPNS